MRARPAVSLLTAVALVAACDSSSAERQLLSKFFRFSRVRDAASLANVASIPFDPRADGSVLEFAIARVGSDERRLPRSSAERAVALQSLDEPDAVPVDSSDAAIELVTRQVTVAAQVRDADGATTPRTLVFTLQRGLVRHDGQTAQGRWLVTGFGPAEAGPHD